MVEHEICKGCKWNKYPLCEGTIMDGGNEMNIENLRTGFGCGQKDEPELEDFSIRLKSAQDLRIEALEARIAELEKGV